MIDTGSGTYLLYEGLPLKCQFVVIVKIGKLFPCRLDSTWSSNVVNATFLKQFVKHVTLIIETGSLYLATLIK